MTEEQPQRPEVEQDMMTIENIPVPPSSSAIKSSNEILCELFGAFNATPPSLDNIAQDSDKKISGKKLHKKHKKHTKKKNKKDKKKKRFSSSDLEKRTVSKKKVLKKIKKEKVKETPETYDLNQAHTNKQKKRKLGKFSASDADSDEVDLIVTKKTKFSKEKLSKKPNKDKIKKEKDCNISKRSLSAIPDSIKENILKHAVSKIVDKVLDSSNLASEIISKSISKIALTTTFDEDKELIQNIPTPPIKQENPQDEKFTNKDNSAAVVESLTHIQKPTIDKANVGILSHNEPLNNKTKSDSSLLENKCLDKTFSPLPVADVFAEDLMDCNTQQVNQVATDKPKPAAGKITIKNLKFSQVYEATLKQVEEEAKQKAEKYEEGELSESSQEQVRSPTPSETSSNGSDKRRISRKKEESHRHRCRRKRDRHRSWSNEKKRSTSEENHKYESKRYSSHSKDEGFSRNEHRPYSDNRHRGRHRTEGRDRTRGRSEDKSSRVRKTEKERHRSKERSRSRDKTTSELRRERSLERKEKHKQSRKHSHHRSEGKSTEEKIDKKKLLEIARKNALNMMKNPAGILEQTKVTITAGGKTVNELTDFCKLLSKKDADGHESISSYTSHSSDSESEKPFHHPFLIKDRPSNIVLNIRNSVALPVKSLQEKTVEHSKQLRLQFPVSSGQHHRTTESEWTPVSPKKTESVSSTTNTQVAVIKPTPKHNQVIKDAPAPLGVDVGSIVSQRLMALRKLQENPGDCEALSQMYKAQKHMQNWAESKQQPLGQFTGSTGVRVLSQAELASGSQAWARKDQLQAAAPVSSGMGMALLQKMGWRPGEGLGKNKEGTLQPLMLEVKMDKKGLVAQEEMPVRQPNQVIRGAPRTLEGKHPVSLLVEYCSRRKYGAPYFELVDEAGPDHKKNFLFKVTVNGVEYKPAVGGPKKKQARAEAAEVCLRALGVLPNK